MKTILAGSLFALFATQALAAEGDMMTGTFGTHFCGAPATFEISSHKGGWVFEGKVLIRDTTEYDRVSIKQYEDNSLRITRYLSGQHAGQKQWAFTSPPKLWSENGRTAATFHADKGNGIGCNNARAYTRLEIVY